MTEPDPDVSTSTVADVLQRTASMLSHRPMLIVSDFDGTLAEPRLDPWGAGIVPLARRALRRLAVIEGVHVAFLSGRMVADLSARVRVGGADYLGNQGLERGRLERSARAEALVVEPMAFDAGPRRTAELLADQVPRFVPGAWLVVEHKYPAVTFHYRGAPDVAAAGERVRDAVERLDPDATLVRYQGRRALELRPAGAPGKGDAFRELLDRYRPTVAFMLGDDRTDVAAFRILRESRIAGALDGLAIAVASPAAQLADVAQEADEVLASPVETARFLSGLVRHIQNTSR